MISFKLIQCLLYMYSCIHQRVLSPSVREPIRCFLCRKSRAKLKNRAGSTSGGFVETREGQTEEQIIKTSKNNCQCGKLIKTKQAVVLVRNDRRCIPTMLVLFLESTKSLMSFYKGSNSMITVADRHDLLPCSRESTLSSSSLVVVPSLCLLLRLQLERL